ncbi:predicted protein [Uncinocarpus reesii 1704]|uniref:Uncharacterized protein n=1 Tax=Uncinocarpus reesii (strain UAMH 1704) TaxID=336963 RepID=C4JI86_UNCRE|nr:uncharacterized protein UREG_02832 [Uncinocarpus reesii 1704]EEP77983.1 predicted protein [Uncinocarpus reesii 1704]
MPKTRSLLRQEITYSFAKKEEVNVLHRLQYVDLRERYFTLINARHGWMKAIVAHHLNLGSSEICRIADTAEWYCGSFNVCVPITIENWNWRRKQPGKRVILRFPLPYRVGESFRPGNGDEKVRCEAGTYAWLQENCPSVPIPRLYGFAMSTGETFTNLEYRPFLVRCFHSFRFQLLSWLRLPVPSQYIRHQGTGLIADDSQRIAAYLLVEHIEADRGTMLSCSWSENRHNIDLRSNLFRSFSRIILSIARLPQPRIGSFIINNSGFLQLTNRPLSIELQDLENEEIPTHISRNTTYATVNEYVTDILGIHGSRIRHQPGAIHNIGDYCYQVAALATMRTVLPAFFDRQFSRGPFVFTFTDFNQSNIFVDENWNITCLVDLEWACTKPIEMVETPIWLTNKAMDEIAEDSDEFAEIWMEFVDFLASEEDKNCMKSTNIETRVKLSSLLKQGFEIGRFWYHFAVTSPTGLFTIFYKQIKPRFKKNEQDEESFFAVEPWYWSLDFVSTVTKKLEDKKQYDLLLQHAFDEHGDDTIEN